MELALVPCSETDSILSADVNDGCFSFGSMLTGIDSSSDNCSAPITPHSEVSASSADFDSTFLYPEELVIKNTFIDVRSRKIPKPSWSAPVSKTDGLIVAPSVETAMSQHILSFSDQEFHISKTFVNIASHGVPPILDGCMMREHAKSCPGSNISYDYKLDSRTDFIGDILVDEISLNGCASQHNSYADDVETVTSARVFTGNVGCACSQKEPALNTGAMVWHKVEDEALARMEICLAEAIAEPELGSPELPTVGSRDHHLGFCRPCAFLHRGCTKGTACTFCHLCSPDERKRRRKEKLKEVRRLTLESPSDNT